MSIASRLDQPVSNASLVVFRVLFGTLVSLELAALLAHGAAEAMFHHPAVHFTYLGFGWIRPLPGWGLTAHFVLTLLAGVGIATGCLYRASCLTFCLGWTWFWMMDKAYYQNHSYLISLIAFWMAFMPANGRLAIDSARQPALRTTVTPRWTIWLLRAMIGIVYFYAGLAKLDVDWLQGAPLRLHFQQMAGTPLIGGFLASAAFTDLLLPWGGLIFDLLIVPALLWRRSRGLAFVAAMTFHGFNCLVFQIDIFPFLAIGATLLFFDPDWPERLLARIRRRPEVKSAPRSGALRATTTPVLRAGILGFVAIQLLVPFHHLLYTGDHNWTEEGQRFSWFLMQRTKSGRIMYLVHVPQTSQKFRVDPARYLVSRQVEKLAIEPDMILQFAHFLERSLASDYPGDLEIRAYVQVQLNGRKPAELIDHTVDLTNQLRHWGSYTWVRPHPDVAESRTTTSPS